MLRLISLCLALLQGPALSIADARAVTRAVIEHLAPANDPRWHGKPDRPLIIDWERSRAALAKVVPALADSALEVSRPARRLSTGRAIQCRALPPVSGDKYRPPARECHVAYDGIVVTISSITPASTPGEWLVVASAYWTDASPGGRERLVGAEQRCFVARVDGIWKIVRIEVAWPS